MNQIDADGNVKPKRSRGYRFDFVKYERDKQEREAERERQWIAEMDAMGPLAGWCYFIESAEGRIKIGYSGSPNSRLAHLRRETPYQLKIAAKVSGGRERECYYHHRFKEHRIEGEWFSCHPDILAEIARLNQNGPESDRHRSRPYQAKDEFA